MVTVLNILVLLTQLAIMSCVLRQLWYPYRSALWARAWRWMLLAAVVHIGKQVAMLSQDVSLLEVLLDLTVNGCLLSGLWTLVRLYALILAPPPSSLPVDPPP